MGFKFKKIKNKYYKFQNKKKIFWNIILWQNFKNEYLRKLPKKNIDLDRTYIHTKFKDFFKLVINFILTNLRVHNLTTRRFNHTYSQSTLIPTTKLKILVPWDPIICWPRLASKPLYIFVVFFFFSLKTLYIFVYQGRLENLNIIFSRSLQI